MCGRYVLYSDIEQTKSLFPIDEVALDEAAPDYNMAPTQEIAQEYFFFCGEFIVVHKQHLSKIFLLKSL